jgi:MFS family permease
MAMFGSITFLPMYLQLAKGVSPTDSALQLLPMMVGLIGGSMISGFIMTRTGRYRMLPRLSTFVLTIGMLLLARMSLDTPSWQIAGFMLLVGIGIGPVNSVSVTATQNAVPRALVGVATAGTTLFRQVGGSIGVSVFGAIFSSGLAARMGDLLPGSEGTASFDASAVAAMPPALREQVLEAFAGALHPVFFVAAAVAALAFGLTFLLEERPLSNTLREDPPEAELDAAEQGAASISGVPATATR